jgi:hypothetical protein
MGAAQTRIKLRPNNKYHPRRTAKSDFGLVLVRIGLMAAYFPGTGVEPSTGLAVKKYTRC